MLNHTKIYALLFLQVLLLAPIFVGCSKDDDGDCPFSSFLLHADYIAVENSILASDEDPFFSADWDSKEPFRRDSYGFLALDITFRDSILSREKLVNHSIPWGPSQAWACTSGEEKFQFARSVDTIIVELVGDTSTSSYNAHFGYFIDGSDPYLKTPSMSAVLEENKKVSERLRVIRCVAPIGQLPVGKELRFKTTVGFDNDEEMTTYSSSFFIE